MRVEPTLVASGSRSGQTTSQKDAQESVQLFQIESAPRTSSKHWFAFLCFWHSFSLFAILVHISKNIEHKFAINPGDRLKTSQGIFEGLFYVKGISEFKFCRCHMSGSGSILTSSSSHSFHLKGSSGNHESSSRFWEMGSGTAS